MKDLRDSLGAVWRAACQAGPPSGGRSVMFVDSVNPQFLASLTASFALLCAKRSAGAVWLLDLDFRENTLFHAFDNGFAGEKHRPGQAFDSRLGGKPLYGGLAGSAIATRKGADPNKLLALHTISGLNLLVSRFRTEALGPGQKLLLLRRAEWWNAARKKAEWIIVHAPLTRTTGTALSMARDVDGVIMCVDADRTTLEQAARLRDDVEAENGRLIGSVMADIGADAQLVSRVAA